jgi:hypothetical protein
MITGNTFVVREENDIQRISRELYALIERSKRSRGIKL